MNESQREKKGLHIILWFIIWLIIILSVSEYALSVGYPWKFSNLEPYMLRKTNDDWTHNAFEMERIKKRGCAGNEELFVFMGGSISLEIISDDSVISKRLIELVGHEVRFTSLCASYQTPADHAKIIDRIKTFSGTLLIGIEPLTFKATIDNQLTERLKNTVHLKYYYLPISSRTDQILSEHGLNPGFTHRVNLFRTVRVFGEIFKKRGKHFFSSDFRFKKINYNRHTVGDKTLVDEDEKERLINWLKKLLIKYEENYQLNLDLFKETIDIAQSNGIKVVIIDLPQNPIFEESIDNFNPHYDNMVKDLVNEKGIGYIDMRHVVDLTPEDFRDVHHMRSQGQAKFAEALAVKLAEYISSNSNGN